MQRRKQRGITLLELMTTIGIAAILISIGVPSMSAFTLNSKRASAVNELVSAMHLAKNAAAMRGARVTVCASGNGSSCQAVAWDQGWIVFVDENNDQAVGAGETILRTGSEIDDVSVLSAEFPTFFIYRPNGRVMAANIATTSGNFTVCDRRGSQNARVISINMSGRPQVSDHKLDGNAPVCI